MLFEPKIWTIERRTREHSILLFYPITFDSFVLPQQKAKQQNVTFLLTSTSTPPGRGQGAKMESADIDFGDLEWSSPSSPRLHTPEQDISMSSLQQPSSDTTMDIEEILYDSSGGSNARAGEQSLESSDDPMTPRLQMMQDLLTSMPALRTHTTRWTWKKFRLAPGNNQPSNTSEMTL